MANQMTPTAKAKYDRAYKFLCNYGASMYAKEFLDTLVWDDEVVYVLDDVFLERMMKATNHHF